MTDATPAFAADDEPLCPTCVAHEGLCRKHERQILPQLAQPFKLWKLLAKKRRAAKELRWLSTPAEKARRKRTRRLERAMHGGFTRSRPRAA